MGYTDVILVGDFNVNILEDRRLSDDMSAIGLNLVNHSLPTHFTRTSNTLLDLCFVNNMSRLLLYDQLSASLFSKHDLIFLAYDFHTEIQNQTIYYRDFKNLDYQSLTNELSTIQWNRMFYMTNVDDQVNFLHNNMDLLYNKYINIKTKRIRNEHPWFSNEIKLLIAKRNHSYARWKRFKTTELHETFKSLRNRVNTLVKISKSKFYEEHFKSAVCSKMKWKSIRNMGIINQENNDAKECIDVNQLNQLFLNIPMPTPDTNFYTDTYAHNSAHNDYSPVPNRINNSDRNNSENQMLYGFEFKNTTQEDVLESILSIKSESAGHDGVHPKFVKLILPYILPQITHLFNTILTTSTFPYMWKHAKIIPIPKPNHEFRPIAILPYLSKVFERLIHSQISKYLQDNSLLTDKQSGFRPKHSCVSTLLEVSEELRINVDDNRISFLVLLDHSKAFDTVEHSILCLKLKHMCKFSPTAVKLISSYLHDRYQAVYYGNNKSNSCLVSRGVPQGSILGPLLYSIYSNDLPSQLKHCGIQMYADDVQLYISCHPSDTTECISKLNQDLDTINTWASRNGLCLNAKKTKAMVIGKSKLIPTSLPPIQINNSSIEIVETAKNLGVIFNSKLDWSNHINVICGRTFSMLRNLWMTQYYTPFEIRMLLAKTYLIPTLMYGCELFASCDSASKKKLNVTFNNIARYVFGLTRFSRISRFAKQLYNISFDNLLKCRCLIFLHKTIYTKQPGYLFNRIIFSRSNRGKKINSNRYRSQISERHFFINSIQLWNQLPNNIQTTSNAQHFKREVFRHFS